MLPFSRERIGRSSRRNDPTVGAAVHMEGLRMHVGPAMAKWHRTEAADRRNARSMPWHHLPILLSLSLSCLPWRHIPLTFCGLHKEHREAMAGSTHKVDPACLSDGLPTCLHMSFVCLSSPSEECDAGVE